jgi:hemerythrin superfamily protein
MSKPKDAVALLTKDHAEVHKLFLEEEKMGRRSASGKVDLFNQIKAALEVHTTVEEEIFYPAVKKVRSEHIEGRGARGGRRAQADQKSARANLGNNSR